jgi:hypothetical protein
MNRVLFGFSIGLVLSSLNTGQAACTENRREYAFAEHGSIRMQLSSGSYIVRAGNSDRLVVQWQAEDPAFEKDMSKIRVRTSISGKVASIRTEGRTKHARITIEVPVFSNLYLRMRAGEVRITGIEGNKDVHLTAGDLKINVVPNSYSYVHASVTVGDLRAGVLGISKDGFGNSLNWNGPGNHTLKASLFAGDLTLENASDFKE